MPMALVQPAHAVSSKHASSPKSGRRRQPITACRVCTFFNLLSIFALLLSSLALVVLDIQHGVFESSCDNSGSELVDGTLRGCGENVGIGDICELCLWGFVATLFMCDICIKRRLMRTAKIEGDAQPRLLIPALPFIIRIMLCIKVCLAILRSRLAFQRLLIDWFQADVEDGDWVQNNVSHFWHIMGFYESQESIVASLLRVVRAFFSLVLVLCGLTQRTMEVSQFDPQRVNIDDGGDEQEETEEPVVLEERQSREQGSSICEQITFSWTNKLLSAGFRAPLQITQIFLMRADYGPMVTAADFGEFWDMKVRAARKQHNARVAQAGTGGAQAAFPPKFLLVKTLIVYFWKELLLSALLVLGQIATSLLQPVLLNALLHFMATPVGPDDPVWVGYALACAMVFCQFFQNILITQFTWILQNTGVRMRGALSVMIFRKAM